MACNCNPNPCSCEDLIFPTTDCTDGSIKTSCSYYTGNNIACADIQTNDSLDTVILKMATLVCNMAALLVDKYVRVSPTDTVSGYLQDKISKLSPSVTVTKVTEPDGEKLLFTTVEDYRTKISEDKAAGYLLERIFSMDDPSGFVKALPIETHGDSMYIGYTVDTVALCNKLTETGCIPQLPSCPVAVNEMTVVAVSESGLAQIEVSASGTQLVADTYEYSIDNGIIYSTTQPTFFLSGLGAGNHSIMVRGRCSNGIAGPWYFNGFMIPKVTVLCPTFTLIPTDTSITVAWHPDFSHTYSLVLSRTENGTPIANANSNGGAYTFDNLIQNTQYWVKIIPTKFGITRNDCAAQTINTIMTICNAVIDNLSITNVTTSGTATISWSLISGVASTYEYNIDNGSWISTSQLTANITGLSVGGHSIYVRPKCSNGIYGSTISAPVTILTPVCLATINNLIVTSLNSNGTAIATWGGSGASNYEFNIDSSTWANADSPLSLSGLSAGAHVISVRAKCANGIYSSNTATYSFTIPQATCTATIDTLTISNVTTSGSATGTWTATGAVAYQYKVDTGSYVDTNSNSVALTGLTQGTHTLYVRAKCSNGLFGASNSSNITITAPPVVCNAPSGITFTDTVITSNIIEWAYLTVDPYSNLANGIDNITYQFSSQNPIGTDISANFTSAANNKFVVLRTLASEQSKTSWFNTSFNLGTINPPDSVMRGMIQFGGHKYYVSRDTFTFDSTSYTIVYKN